MNLNLAHNLLKTLSETSLDGSEVLSKEDAFEKYLNWIEDVEGKNLSEMRGILESKGNVQIISCAGSGKTTTMIYKIIGDWIKGDIQNLDNSLQGVWLCTFLKKGAVDLREKLNEKCKAYSEYAQKENFKFTPFTISKRNVSTMHSDFYQLIKDVESEPVVLIDEKANDILLKNTLKEHSVNVPKDSDAFEDIKTALIYTRNRMDEKKFEQDIYDDLDLKPDIIKSVLKVWKSKRIAKGVYDFEDLQEKLYEECYVNNNPKYINAITNRYQYLYIDEFQDTSQLQYQIIKLYAKKATKTIVIGDDDQIIYTWRGSCGEIIKEDFLRDFKNVEKHRLSVNFRCPDLILKPAVLSIEQNESRIVKPISAFKKGGTCRVLQGSTYIDMGLQMVEEVIQDANKGMSVAILCRTNADGLLPSLLLSLDNKVDFKIKTDAMTLAKGLGRKLRMFTRLFLDSTSNDVFECLSLIADKDRASAKQLFQNFKTEGTSLWDIAIDDYTESRFNFYRVVGSFVEYRRTHTDLETLYYIYDYMANFVYFQDDESKHYSLRKDTSKAICEALIYIIREIEADVKAQGTECTIEDVDYYLTELSENLESKIENTDAKISIATVHEYKGAEVDSVYIWNDTNRMFPHVQGLSKSTMTDMEEERRIHYIAMTRALKKCTIMTIKKREGKFLKETGLLKKER